MSDSPLSPRELRAAAETHQEIGHEYRDAVLESFIERVGREIDARVDARLAQAARSAPPPAPTQPPAMPAYPNVRGIALGSIALGIPITAIVATAGNPPVGFWGVLVVWLAIAVINLGYAARLRPPTGRR